MRKLLEKKIIQWGNYLKENLAVAGMTIYFNAGMTIYFAGMFFSEMIISGMNIFFAFGNQRKSSGVNKKMV